MKILVTGVNGQLGFDVVRKGLELGLEIMGIGRAELDITKRAEVYSFVKDIQPSVIIHCAAYTAVDQAEDDQESCWDVNVKGTEYLANAAKSVNAKFLYISTDYVFKGDGENPFLETDPPHPLSTYGLTKYEGEKKIKDALDEHFIVRVSWVFGVNGNNFIKTMLKLSESLDELNVVGDQVGSPTYTYDLASLLLEMIHTDKYGIYHATNEGYCSWSEFAGEIFKQRKISVKVNAIPTEEYFTKVVRPKNSRLSKSKLKNNGFQPLPKWEDAVQRYLIELNREV